MSSAWGWGLTELNRSFSLNHLLCSVSAWLTWWGQLNPEHWCHWRTYGYSQSLQTDNKHHLPSTGLSLYNQQQIWCVGLLVYLYYHAECFLRKEQNKWIMWVLLLIWVFTAYNYFTVVHCRHSWTQTVSEWSYLWNKNAWTPAQCRF